MDRNQDRMLRALDPGSRDAGYWPRFHRGVMERAQLHLARRRAEMRLTVSRLIFGWSRAVVPASLAAAAVAGFMLMGLGDTGAPSADAAPVDILAAGATFDPLPELALPEQESIEAGIPELTLVAVGEGY